MSLIEEMMKSIFLRGLLLTTFFCMPVISNAAHVANQTASVTRVGTFGDGSLWIFLDTTVNIPGCAKARLDIAPNHPEIDAWHRIAQEALVTGMRVTFQARGCRTFINNGVTGSYPTLDNTTYSWFGLSR